MHIISKFHDYYDGIAKQGIDKDLRYLRESESHVLSNDFINKHNYPQLSSSRYETSFEKINLEISLGYLGFCGKVYPYIKVIFNNQINFFYELNSFQTYAEENNFPINFKEKKQSRWLFRFNLKRASGYIDFFSQEKIKSLEKIFQEKNIPCFSYLGEANFPYNKILTINPCLKDFQFFKVKDTYSCFQDLSMYLGGVLNQPPKPLVQISNEDKIHKHGFDKWSFRKPPSS